MPVNACSDPSGPRLTHRNAPFGRRSISHTESGAPLGSHHCVTCSAFVQASKTTVRGASKVRAMTMWRSEGVVTFALPVCSIADLSLSLRAFTSFLLLPQFTQVAVEAGESLLPEASIGLHPFRDVLERERDKRARTPL